MYTLYKFHFLNGISEINPTFDDILIIWQHLYSKIMYLYKSIGEIKHYKDYQIFNMHICSIVQL